MSDLPDEFPPDLKQLIEDWIEVWRAEGTSEAEIEEQVRGISDLAGEIRFGLVDVVSLPDGRSVLVEKDPFADLPVTIDREE